MLDITHSDDGGAFAPFAQHIDGGVRLHLCGQIEALALAKALLEALGKVDLRGLAQEEPEEPEELYEEEDDFSDLLGSV